MNKLHIAPDLTLPLDFVTERIAFLARTGAGKSGSMRVLAEEMLDAKQFVIFLDPKGDAWGICSDYSVLVMGGDHCHIPLSVHDGKFVADFLVKERISTVLDVSHFSEADMVRFVGDFADELYRTNKEVVHLFLDEADEFAPQSGYNAAALKCLGAIQRIQRRGRGRGIGVTLATQRSAVINKSVLTQAGTLIAMQTTAPHDLKAVDAWLEYAATKEARSEIMTNLPLLKPREAYIYSPQLLGQQPRRIKFREFKSFDSMKTPKPGETITEPKKLVDLDLTAIKASMSNKFEEIKQNDPAELKREVARLSRELAENKPKVDVELIVHKAVSERDIHWKAKISALLNGEGEAPRPMEKLTIFSHHKPIEQVESDENLIGNNKVQAQTNDVGLTKIEQGLLQAFYWLSDEEANAIKVSFYSGYSVTSSAFPRAINNLRAKGLITDWTINFNGIQLASQFTAQKPSGLQLREFLRGRLSNVENSFLDIMIKERGRVSMETLAERSGYSKTSSAFGKSLNNLRNIAAANGTERDGGIQADEIFFR